MTEVRAKVRGMYTGASTRISAAEGGMRVATNVVYERAATASPRPGFALASYTSSAKSCRRILPWGGDSSAAVRVNSDSTSAWLSAPTSYITIDGSSDVDYVTPSFAGATAARNSLFLSGTEGGLRKLTGSSDVIAPVAGMNEMPLVYSVIGGATANVVADDYFVAYRTCIRRIDVNGLVTRGPAVGRYRYRNTSGATIDPRLLIILPQDAAAGDVLEIYRTESSETNPDDEFYLARERELTSTDITNTYVDITDTTEDEDLGAALYTNDSREGDTGANFRAPSAVCSASFNGSLFAGYLLPPSRIVLKWNEGGNRSGQATGIGYRTTTGDYTNGSNQILNVASTTGVQVGMILDGLWASYPARVTGIAGTTVTVSANYANTTVVGANVTFYDSVRIGSEYFMANNAATLIATINGDPFGLTEPSDTYYAYGVGTYGKSNSSGVQNVNQVTVVIEERESHADEDSVYATHGDEYVPICPLPSASADPDVYVRREIITNGLAYSKKDEPEHFPVDHFDRVGSDSGYLLAMVSTRDALWLFKTDGIYRLSGAVAPRWRIDPVDLNARLLHQSCVTKVGEDVYAFTSVGVVRVSDAGITVVSNPISDQLEYHTRAMQADFANTVAAAGAWMASDPTSGNVLLGLPGTVLGYDVTSDFASVIFCYNAGTGEWSKWEFPFAELVPG